MMTTDPNSPLPSPSASLRRQLTLSWVLMLLLVVILVMPALKLWFNFGVSGDPRPITPRGALADFEQTTVSLFKEASPSVVYITTRSKVADYRYRREVEVESGTGSGFVWDAEGHIVTNYHVIKGASSAQVVFYDQTSYEADLVSSSPDHDLAVLRIKAPPSALRPMLIGESHDLEIGQSVFAIGNPFGLDQTLTTGVVSAKSRNIVAPSGTPIEDVIQIDAAINPGNSGGPLLDSAGRLIGVNTAIYSPSGTSAGVGFSIPVDTVNRVVPQIIQRGRYEPPKLGMQIDEGVNQIVQRSGGPVGVVVVSVDEGGAAAAAGLEPLRRTSRQLILGDVITAINGESVRTCKELLDVLQNYRPGDKIDFEIIRDGRETQLSIVTE